MAGDGIEPVVAQAQAVCGLPRGSELQQRLENFQGLQRTREADRPRRYGVSRRGLGHHRADEVTGQEVRPHLLAHQLRRLATQLAHLHRRLDAAQVDLGIPARPISVPVRFGGAVGKGLRKQRLASALPYFTYGSEGRGGGDVAPLPGTLQRLGMYQEHPAGAFVTLI